MPMRRGCEGVPGVEAGSMRQHSSIQARPAATEANAWVSVAVLLAFCVYARRLAGRDRTASRQYSGRWKKLESSESREASCSEVEARSVTWPSLRPARGDL